MFCLSCVPDIFLSLLEAGFSSSNVTIMDELWIIPVEKHHEENMILPLVSSPPTHWARREKESKEKKKQCLTQKPLRERVHASVFLSKHQPFMPFYCFISLQTFFLFICHVLGWWTIQWYVAPSHVFYQGRKISHFKCRHFVYMHNTSRLSFLENATSKIQTKTVLYQ